MNTEQVKCLPDPVSCLRKTENTGVDRIVARVLVGPSAQHCFIRRIVYAWFARVCHGRSVPYAPDRMNNLNLRCTTLCRPSGIRTLGCFRKWCGSPVGLDPLPDPNFGTSSAMIPLVTAQTVAFERGSEGGSRDVEHLAARLKPLEVEREIRGRSLPQARKRPW